MKIGEGETMNIDEAVKSRHSVREYTEEKIAPAVAAELEKEIAVCNEEGDLNMQLILDEAEAFGGMMSRLSRFRNARNYLAIVGPKTSALSEKAGYYGERVLLKATMLGLDSCWVAQSFSKSKCTCAITDKEKLACVISLGCGVTHGTAHKSKQMDELCLVDGEMPAWFRKGMEYAMLAPTAINQQKFVFALNEKNTVVAESTGGFYSDIDLGIVKYHFELGAGKENFTWQQKN